MALETRNGCFGVNDSNVATLPVQAPWQGNDSGDERRPWIWEGWSGWDCARRCDSLCDNALGVSPAGESVVDSLSLGGCDFRWNDRDVISLRGLGDGLSVIDC